MQTRNELRVAKYESAEYFGYNFYERLYIRGASYYHSFMSMITKLHGWEVCFNWSANMDNRAVQMTAFALKTFSICCGT